MSEGDTQVIGRNDVVPPSAPWLEQYQFANAVVVDGPIVVGAGQCGIYDDQSRGFDCESQMRQAFQNMKEQLAKAGVGVENVFSLTVFIADARDMPSFVKVQEEFFPGGPYPASAVIEAKPMLGLLCEVQFMATLGTALRRLPG